MIVLETIDRRDREDGTPRAERLRQIPRETGQFLAILAAGAPEGAIIEIGTSAGYSARPYTSSRLEPKATGDDLYEELILQLECDVQMHYTAAPGVPSDSAPGIAPFSRKVGRHDWSEPALDRLLARARALNAGVAGHAV